MPRKSEALFSSQSASLDLLEDLQRDEQGFLVISKRIKELTGIHLPISPKNLSLVAGRLHSIIRRHGIAGYISYDRLLSRGTADLREEFVSAITTNTTQFFREEPHYQLLQSILPKLLEEKRRHGSRELRFWCAASSTGQEPYSLVMTIKQFLGAYPGIELKFLASDIDTAVLGRAASGIYSYEDLKSLPAFLRTKWVKELENGRGQMTAAIRDSIRFARFNLQTERWPFQHPFDVIFCRNVLIYFDRETCLRIVEQMVQSLAPGGFLFLGHSESGMLRNDELQLIGNAVAQKRIR